MQQLELQTKFENYTKTLLTYSEYTVNVDHISQAKRNKIFIDIL